MPTPRWYMAGLSCSYLGCRGSSNNNSVQCIQWSCEVVFIMSRAAHILNLSREVTRKKSDKGVKRKLFNSLSGPKGSPKSASMDKVIGLKLAWLVKKNV